MVQQIRCEINKLNNLPFYILDTNYSLLIFYLYNKNTKNGKNGKYCIKLKTQKYII